MYLGIDFGTSGARACVISDNGAIQHEQRLSFREAQSQTADEWKLVLHQLLRGLPDTLGLQIKRIAIDATSATVLLCDASLQPVSPVLFYNDTRASAEAGQLKQLAPQAHAVCQASSGLAKFLWLVTHCNPGEAAHFMHQADWLAALLTGAGGISDYHNALKTGFDVETMTWPDWISQLPHVRLLPQVVAPGNLIGEISPAVARHFSLNPDCTIHAGTTDSIAAFIAAQVYEPGDAVTSLGTTLVLKLLSRVRVESAQYGVYSHRFGDLWLAGGASNAGAGVLRQFFTDEQLVELSQQIDTSKDSPLDYYPLPCPGERFPLNDSEMKPRLEPRPSEDAAFLHGILQGLARIEAEGYAKLAELGASPLKNIRTAGGGAKNPAWLQIRKRMLNVPIDVARHSEAAYGAALLARHAGIITGKPLHENN
jgi:D-ribulokinase